LKKFWVTLPLCAEFWSASSINEQDQFYPALEMKTTKALFFCGLFLLAHSVFSQRVISMAPAVTEIVFALGKGGTLVGVTKFCDYPAPARKIARIGGLLDVNMEALLALAPEIVIAYPETYEKVKFLGSRALVLVVKHQTLSDLYDSILTIGRALHAESAAKGMVLGMQKELAAIAAKTTGRKKMRTLIIAGRNADELKNMYIVGKNDFLNELLEIAGGVNAYQGEVNYPSISMETVIFLNPDFILEISSFYEGISDENIFKLWSPFTMIGAVRGKKIKIIKQSYWLRPGSRVGLIAKELAGIFVSAASAGESVNRD
jgi:iron complex transport system substrate-binding protein